MREIEAQLPRYRVRTGYDVIERRYFAEVICGAELVQTFFSEKADVPECRARARIAQLQGGKS